MYIGDVKELLVQKQISTRVTLAPERRAWSIPETCQRLGVSRNFLLSQVRRGLLRARKLGRRTIVLTEDLEEYLRSSEPA
jgi:excisionase family DNA binding protein